MQQDPAAAAAAAWLHVAEQRPGEDVVAELGAVLPALRALETDAALWPALDGLQRLPWPRLRAAEARLRARACEAVARARYEGLPLPETWEPDAIRPPWCGDLPGRVAACALCRDRGRGDLAETEVLCTLDCCTGLCDSELCWQCWHLEECGGRPAEVQRLLALARAAAAAAAPGHRARLIEQRWDYLSTLAAAVRNTVASAVGSGRAPHVLVLGGVGMTAVTAAREGAAQVTVWEEQGAVADVIRQVIEANGVSQTVAVIGELVQDIALPDILVLEGLEPDGVLGCGVLLQWMHLAGVAKTTGTGADTVVIPSSLTFSVALAQARLSLATGTKISLAAFASAYGGLAPLPRAAQSCAAAAVPPRLLGSFSALAHVDLSLVGEAGLDGRALLRLTADEACTPDSLVVRCEADLGTTTFTFECLHALPSQLNPLPAGGSWSLHGHWNSHNLWFEAEDMSSYAVVPLNNRAFLLDWYSEMMNDRLRNEAFAVGIAEAISWVKATANGAGQTQSCCGLSRCRVADLGCGVGLLSALAAQSGADEVLGIELTPHLARCARRVLDEHMQGLEPALEPAFAKVEVRCADIRSVSCNAGDVDGDGDGCEDEGEGGRQRFDVVVSELLDASALGEKILPFLRHAKCHLLREGGRVVPGRLRVQALLVDAHLPRLRPCPRLANPDVDVDVGVDLRAFEPYWLPARVAAGEWLGMDLDGGMDWTAASEPVTVFQLDFEGPQAGLVEALQEHELRFPLAAEHPDSWNAIVWWFEAEVSPSAPLLSSAPACYRPCGSAATHWLQAVTGVWPFPLPLDQSAASAVLARVRTDGVHLAWTPLGVEAQGSRPQPLKEGSPAPNVVAWRTAVEEAAEGFRLLRQEVDAVGDLARLQALQSAALALAAQPGFFGIEAIPEAITPLLKIFFA